MTDIPNAQEFLSPVHGEGTAASRSTAGKPGILRRIVQAMSESRQAQAEREIANFFAGSDGRLTDAMERRLTGHLLNHNWSD